MVGLCVTSVSKLAPICGNQAVIGTHLHVAIQHPGVQGPIILNPSRTIMVTHTVLPTVVHQAWAIHACGAGHVE